MPTPIFNVYCTLAQYRLCTFYEYGWCWMCPEELKRQESIKKMLSRIEKRRIKP